MEVASLLSMSYSGPYYVYIDETMSLRNIFQYNNDPKQKSKLITDWLREQNVNILSWSEQYPDINLKICWITYTGKSGIQSIHILVESSWYLRRVGNIQINVLRFVHIRLVQWWCICTAVVTVIFKRSVRNIRYDIIQVCAKVIVANHVVNVDYNYCLFLHPH